MRERTAQYFLQPMLVVVPLKGHPMSRKQTLRDLSRLWPSSEETDSLREQLIDATPPIVTAVLGVALLEYELEKGLRRKFKRRDEETWKELTEERGPLATLFAKITAGYALGLYDETVREALHTVRRIRNAFAHSKVPITFNNPLIAKELARVQLPKSKRLGLYRDLASVARAAKEEPRAAYIILCMVLNIWFIDAQTRVHQERTRSIERRLKNPLALAMTGLPLIAGFGEPNYLGWLMRHQSGDPRRPTRPPVRSGAVQESEPNDNEGK